MEEGEESELWKKRERDLWKNRGGVSYGRRGV